MFGGRQTLGRWRAAGKYRWRRQPEGQYSLLYNLSPAALNYLAAAAAAAAVASGGCLERKVIEELSGIEAQRDISAIEDQAVCPLKLASVLLFGHNQRRLKGKKKEKNEITMEERLR